MKKKECPSCAMEIDDKSKICPICAYEFVGYSGAVKWTAIVLLVLLAIYIISYIV
jgi:RNA polymerase subunit RPABC4/transcription elongation factor Spt4